MWKRERVERVDIEEVLKSAPVEAPAMAALAIELPAPVAVAPAASATVAALPQAQKACVLGATLRFKGDLVADEDLTIEGQIDGSVLHTRNLTIGGPGHVRGDIRARRVIIEGKVSGNVYALDSVTLRAGAVLTGDVFARRVAIEDGACISGRVDMDNAPAVPKIDTAAIGGPDESERELSIQEVGELLGGEADLKVG
jgi:cytoskeletal protein CcmA (bactofilin family)